MEYKPGSCWLPLVSICSLTFSIPLQFQLNSPYLDPPPLAPIRHLKSLMVLSHFHHKSTSNFHMIQEKEERVSFNLRILLIFLQGLSSSIGLFTLFSRQIRY
jgi:hypothetical protein